MAYAFSFGGYPCIDPVTEYQAQMESGFDVNIWKDKAISYKCPLGHLVGSGHVLLTRASLDALDLNTLHSLTIQNLEDGVSYELGPFLVVKAVCLTPGMDSDPNACYLLDFVDKRRIAQNTPVDFQINVTAPEHTQQIPKFYTETTNAGEPWTWTTAIEYLWNLTNIGTFPGLPYSPINIPQNFQFLAIDTYTALNTLLSKIHCALQYDPFNDIFGIVDLSSSANIDEIEALKRGFLEFDGDIQESNRARIPRGIRVYFNVFENNYGLEQSTSETANWLTKSYVFKEQFASNYGFDANDLPDTNTQIFWDDLRAIRDGGVVTNDEELVAKTNQIAEKFYGNLSLARRRLKTYIGIHPEFIPNSDLKYVCWKINYQGISTEIATTIGFIDGPNIVSSYDILKDCETLLSPDITRATFPLYYPQSQVVIVEDENPYQEYYYKGGIFSLTENGTDLIRQADCWIFLYPKTGKTLPTGSVFIGKASGKNTIEDDTRLTFIVLGQNVGSGSSSNVLIKVKYITPVYTFGTYYYYHAKIITFDRTATNDISQVEGDLCLAVFIKERLPDLNLIYQATVVATSTINQLICYVVPEFVKLVKPTEIIENDLLLGHAYSIDYEQNANKAAIIDFPTERCYIRDLNFLNSSYRSIADYYASFYIGKYIGLAESREGVLPLYVVDPEPIKVGTTEAGSEQKVNPTRHILLDEGNFAVESPSPGTAKVTGWTVQGYDVSVPKRLYLDFRVRQLTTNEAIPQRFMQVLDDPINKKTIVEFLLLPDGQAPLLSYIYGIYPILVDIVGGNPQISLDIPLKVPYGGTGRTSLTRGATIVGNDIDPVALIPGPPYTIYNHKYNYNYPFPEWAIWSKIKGVTQTGIHTASGSVVRRLEEIPTTDSQSDYFISIHFDRYDNRNILVTDKMGNGGISGAVKLELLRDTFVNMGVFGLERVNNHSNTLTEYKLIYTLDVNEQGTFPYIYDLFLKDGRLGIKRVAEEPEQSFNILIPWFPQTVADILPGYLSLLEGKILLENIVGLGRGGSTNTTNPGIIFDQILASIALEGEQQGNLLSNKTFTTADLILGYTYKGRMGYFCDISEDSLNEILDRFEIII